MLPIQVLSIVAACVAGTSGHSLQSRAVGSPKFAKSTFNDMSVGKEPDVAKVFDAVSVGCTGFIREGKACDPGNDVNAQIAEDPAGSGNNVLEVKYRAHKYASDSGVQFYTKYDSLGDEAMLKYSVYFPDNFDWVHGGKLPGLHGGNMHCTGDSDKPNGRNCFSTRLMWREGGAGEAYLYIPVAEQDDQFCQKCAWEGQTASTCDKIQYDNYCSYDRGSFSFKKGRWNDVRHYIKLNDPGKQNGVFELFLNGQRVMSADNVLFRKTGDMSLSGFLFSTFFGGDSSRYAPDSDQRCYFKDFAVYGG